MKRHEYLYFFMLYFLHFLYFLLFAGFEIYELSEYIDVLNFYFRMYICLFLIVRFHPFRKFHSFSEFDRQVVFTSAIMILTTIGVTKIRDYIQESTDLIQNEFTNYGLV